MMLRLSAPGAFEHQLRIRRAIKRPAPNLFHARRSHVSRFMTELSHRTTLRMPTEPSLSRPCRSVSRRWGLRDPLPNATEFLDRRDDNGKTTPEHYSLPAIFIASVGT